MRNCRTNQINVAEGAVRAGKTVDNIFAFAYELETTPDKLHLASGSTIGNAKLNIGACNGYGLEGIFRGRCRWGKYKGNEALMIYTATGEKVVIFAGGELASSFKKIRGNAYGMWIATEINLHHDSFIQEAFNRQLAAKRIKVFWDLNPSHPKHEIYTKYIDNYAAKQKKGELVGGYNYEHFTIFDNATLPEERIKEIVSRYDEGSIWYNRDILGIRSVSEGLIYPVFASVTTGKRKDNYFFLTNQQAKEMADRRMFNEIVIGVDFGGNGSGHAFVCTTHTKGYKELVALSSELHAEIVEGNRHKEIDPEILSNLFVDFVKRMRQTWGYVTKCYCDSAEPVLIRGLKRALVKAGMGNVQVSDARKSRVNDRIDCTATLLAQKRFLYTEDCATLETAMQMTVWQSGKIERIRLDDGTTDIDSLDAFEYSFEGDINKYVPKRG